MSAFFTEEQYALLQAYAARFRIPSMIQALQHMVDNSAGQTAELGVIADELADHPDERVRRLAAAYPH